MLNEKKENGKRTFSETSLSASQLPLAYPATKLTKIFQISKYLSMSICISPVGLSAAPTANELHVLATIKERFCNSFCVNADLLPSAFTTYKIGTGRLQGTTLFIPIDVTVTVVVPSCNCNCNNAQPKLYHERFVVAFANQTAVSPATLVQNGTDVQPAFFNQCNCNRANGIAINDELLITITPAA